MTNINPIPTTSDRVSCPNCKQKTLYKKHPIYVDLIPPCNNACPAGENIQAWLNLAQAGKFKAAFEKIIENNPMPAIHGRVCYHPCENNCNRKQFDSTVSIHAIERFIGDMALSEGWQVPENPEVNTGTGKKVLVVGAGPAGLSAAYHLKRFGHDVTIYEASSRAGGMMHLGIPDYRLPPDVLAGEIKRIIDMGINLKLNHKVTDLLAEKEKGRFDAIFIGIGAYKGKLVDVPTQNNPCPIWDSLRFLTAVKAGTLPKIGDNLAIYGGSNTAMDVARTAKRLGVKNVNIIYHRTRQRMAAFQDEITEALEEGANLKVLRQLQCVDNKSLKLNVVELDEKGSPQPTGDVETIAADMLVFALGQTPDSEFLKKVPNIEFKSNGCVLANEQMMTGHDGIFAGGDVLPLDQSVTIAVGHGKKAARNIDAYLNNTMYTKPPKHASVTYEMLNTWFFEKADQIPQSLLDAKTRVKSFDEVVGGLNEQQALFEAKRCFSCGNCFECDGCYGACPEGAITKLGIGKRYKIDKSLCTGCGACYSQCPCAAIAMEKDEGANDN